VRIFDMNKPVVWRDAAGAVRRGKGAP
jgi:hypothetical protein